MKSPRHHNYDVVIIGGAIMGSSTAYFLNENPDFHGRILVIEPDQTYERSSTTLSAASVRHQFSNPVNIEISKFCTEFISEFHQRVQVDDESPDLCFRETGYLFLATDAGMPTLRRNQAAQIECGVDTRILTPQQTHERFPYLNTDDLAGSSIGMRHEGTLDAHSLMQGFRLRACHNGVEYLTNRAVGLDISGGRVQRVRLESGDSVGCGYVVNCAGPRAATIAAMAGFDLPVEPRQRSVFVFDCRAEIQHDFPLTIDTSGVWVRRDSPYFLAGGVPDDDVAVDQDDFKVRHDEFHDQIWPALAHRIPVFDKISVKRSWAGHYSYNTLDQNAIVGPAPGLDNFIFANGFSGHGLQQGAGVGRAINELICYSEYRSIDLTPLGYERVIQHQPFMEDAII